MCKYWIQRFRMMDHYEKTKTEIQDEPLAVAGSIDGIPVMRVTDASKMKNLMAYAVKKINVEGVKQILWTGQGEAVCKAVSCAEIMKRRIEEPLHQITEVGYRRQVDTWEPKEKDSELDSLKVNRDIPSIAVLLSVDPLDVNHSGYQPPGDFEKFWKQKVKLETEVQEAATEETKKWQSERLKSKLAGARGPEDQQAVIAKQKKEKKKAIHKAFIERKKEWKAESTKKKRLPRSQRPKDYISIDNTGQSLIGQSVIPVASFPFMESNIPDPGPPGEVPLRIGFGPNLGVESSVPHPDQISLNIPPPLVSLETHSHSSGKSSTRGEFGGRPQMSIYQRGASERPPRRGFRGIQGAPRGRGRANFNYPNQGNFQGWNQSDFDGPQFANFDPMQQGDYMETIDDFGPPGVDFQTPRFMGPQWRGEIGNRRPRGPRGQNVRLRGPRFRHQGP